MEWNATRSMASIFIGSLIAGCAAGEPAGGYRAVPLAYEVDPLAPPRTVVPWRPPRQMAVWVHPHEDRTRGALVGGHWILVLLGDGSWYFEDETDRDPIPDAEATPEERRAALGALAVPDDVTVPYASKAEKERP